MSSSASTLSSSSTSTSTASPTSSPSPSTSPSLPIPAIVVPLAVIGAVLIGLLIHSNQRKLRNGLNASPNLHRNSTASANTSNDPSFFRKVWSAFKKSFAAIEYPTPNTMQTDGSSASAPTGPRAQRSRRLRRTESGTSVKTVPEYKYDPGEDELVLYKATTIRESRSELSLNRLDSRFSGIDDSRIDLSEENIDPDDSRQSVEGPTRRISVRLSQDLANRSSVALLDTNGFASASSEISSDLSSAAEGGPQRNPSIVGRGIQSIGNSLRRSIGLNTSSQLDDFESSMHRRGSINQMTELGDEVDGRVNSLAFDHNRASRTTSGRSSASHGSRGPAPEYGDLDRPARNSLETVADGNDLQTPTILVSNAEDSRGVTGANGPRHDRNHSNATLLGLRSFFARSSSATPNVGHRRFESTSAISSVPSTGSSFHHSRTGSNVSNQASTCRNSLSLARIHSSLARNNSSTTSLNQSTPPRTSISNISRPLPETLIRSNYEMPRAGISSQQMSFLASVENLGRYGIPTDEHGNSELPPPAFENTEERRIEEDRERERQRNVNRTVAPLLTHSEIYQRNAISENGVNAILPLPGTQNPDEQSQSQVEGSDTSPTHAQVSEQSQSQVERSGTSPTHAQVSE